jgi:hypothetical protein
MPTEIEQFASTLPAAAITRASRLGLTLAPQLQPGAWRELVVHVTRLARTATGARQTLTAWMGDVLVHDSACGRGWIAECAGAARLDAGTLRNAKMVCTRIPVSCRHDALSWTHHCEVGLAFADPNEIERWLALAERERLSTAALRKRIRSHLAGRSGGVPAVPADAVDTFRLMRELRAAARRLAHQPQLWRRWPPATAQFALAELRPLAEFIDVLRARALAEAAPPPRDVHSN